MSSNTLRASATVCALLLLGASGCASPPPVLDLTPRFVVGQTRVESLQHHAALRTPVKDVETHAGFSWTAKVVDVGPEGARIEARVSRVVAKAPLGFAVDTQGGLLGSLLGTNDLLKHLVGTRFEYRVDPAGKVTVTGWQSNLVDAARASGLPLPVSLPDEHAIANALSQVYGAPLPRRPVKLEERWTAHGARSIGDTELDGSDHYQYQGFTELEVPFGADEVRVEGLDVPFSSSPRVARNGHCYLGSIGIQVARLGGGIVVNERGDQVLGYHGAVQLKLIPAEPLFSGDALLIAFVGKLVDADFGWTFFADEWR